MSAAEKLRKALDEVDAEGDIGRRERLLFNAAMDASVALAALVAERDRLREALDAWKLIAENRERDFNKLAAEILAVPE